MDRGWDIRDLGTPTLSYRRLYNFLNQLPREAATTQARYGADVQWPDTNHLLAMIVDALGDLNWMFATVNSEKGNRPKKPRPVPRPTDVREIKTGMSIEELERVIEAQTGAPRGIATGEVT